jgi:hypothetical protein
MKELDTVSYGCTDLSDKQLESVKGGGKILKKIWDWLKKNWQEVLQAILDFFKEKHVASADPGYYDVLTYNYEYA